MLIYKILTGDEWAGLQARGETPGAPVDVTDGLVHFSTAGQLAETAAKHFAGRHDLWLLELDAAGLGEALRWEPARGGTLFPHLYANLRRADVIRAGPITMHAGRHVMPYGGDT